MRAPWVALALAAACAHVEAPPSLQAWVAANIDPAERVLCQREANGEYFFVARRRDDDKLKLGSRVDVSEYPRGSFSLIVAWPLRDENGLSITPRIPPTSVRDEYLRAGEKAYAESVLIQTVNAGRPKRLRAEVFIEKCPAMPCSGASGDGAARYTVHICEAALRQE
jgi:hypothetical protein